jgi:hypothetical protein
MSERKHHNKGTAKLKKITAEAKKLYKHGETGRKWTACVKEAAKKLRK